MSEDSNLFPIYINKLADEIEERRDAPRGHESAVMFVLPSICIKVLTEANHAPYNLSVKQAAVAQCFVCACVWGAHNSLKSCKVETDFIDLCLRVGKIVFLTFSEKDNEQIVVEGVQLFQDLAQNLKNNKHLLDWLNNVNKGIYFYVMDNDNKIKETVIKDVLKPLYFDLLKIKN